MKDFRKGSRIPSGINANEAFKELERIRKKHSILNSDVVVEESRKPGAILHQYFEWDNERAGELFRKQQANYLIRAIVEYGPSDVMHHEYVLTIVNDERQYKPVTMVIENEDEARIALLHLATKLKGALQGFEEYANVLKRTGRKLSKSEKQAFGLVQRAERALSSV